MTREQDNLRGEKKPRSTGKPCVRAALATAACAVVLSGSESPTVPGDRPIAGYVYCSTAEPLGLVFIDLATGREKRLFRDPVWSMSCGPQSRVAVLRNGDTFEVYRDGRLIRQLKVPGPGNDILGWTRDALVYETSAGVHALDIAHGGSRRLEPLHNLVEARPVTGGWVAVNKVEGVLEVELYASCESASAYRWKTGLTGTLWKCMVLGGRYVVLWTREYSFAGNYQQDRVDVLDAVGRKQFALPVHHCVGVAAGASSNELLVGITQQAPLWDAPEIHVQSFHLPDRTAHRLATVGVRESELVAQTPEGAALVMYVPYPDSGPGHPGKVFLVRSSDGHRRVLRENAYECVLSP